MNSVGTMLKSVTGNAILEYIKTLLLQRDREFPGLEEACRNAAQRMGGREEMLALRDRQLVCDLWFAGWQGMKLNLEHYRTPLAAMMMKMDYSDLLREHIMVTMPGHRAADRELDKLLEAMTPQQREALEPVNEFYAHLETMGLKIAHYLGLRLGEMLYPMVEPGYVCDRPAMWSYRHELEQFMDLSLD